MAISDVASGLLSLSSGFLEICQTFSEAASSAFNWVTENVNYLKEHAVDKIKEFFESAFM